METSYAVQGMTCQHCVEAVGRELRALPGVREVTVDLAAGTATVVSETPPDPAAVRAAVDEAGYELVG
ncbi:metal-binding protein [Pilimelia terevasa]|uniref:Metal-binding protein n=1 Tax=Pilimelia terevasa TaxID=53372 RepID=A0A8J3BT25_9ACTN|nr:heavy metal-associated domain-containing protein [Pilimelia terevasa]GGK37574.1 metal-binding protein [Pilimelia terevasa]